MIRVYDMDMLAKGGGSEKNANDEGKVTTMVNLNVNGKQVQESNLQCC